MAAEPLHNARGEEAQGVLDDEAAAVRLGIGEGEHEGQGVAPEVEEPLGALLHVKVAESERRRAHAREHNHVLLRLLSEILVLREGRLAGEGRRVGRNRLDELGAVKTALLEPADVGVAQLLRL